MVKVGGVAFKMNFAGHHQDMHGDALPTASPPRQTAAGPIAARALPQREEGSRGAHLDFAVGEFREMEMQPSPID
jgi:hypothetical protein